MKKILLITLSFFFSFAAIAQNDKEEDDYRPEEGSFTVSLLLGRGSYINQTPTYINNSNAVSGQAPYVNTINTNDNSIGNMAGVEGKYFITDEMAISLNGGFTFRHTPASVNIPAIVDASGNRVVPGYNAIVGKDQYDIHVALGLQWYLELSSPKLIPYVGFSIPFDYARTSQFDPTINFSGTTNVVGYGLEHVELYGLGLQGVAGLDYYLTKDLFIGFDVKPVSYNYVVNTKKPQPGTLGRQAKNSTLSFFGQYFFKIGFKLN